MTEMRKITTDADLAAFRKTPGYLDFIQWVTTRSYRIRGRAVSTHLSLPGPCSNRTKLLMAMLDQLMHLASSIPPQPDPHRRFGSKQFTQFIESISDSSGRYYLPTLVLSGSNEDAALAQQARSAVEQVCQLWIQGSAFGHGIRLDYGTGHEATFVLGLWMLGKLGWGGPDGKMGEPEQVDERWELEEDDLVLKVFTR